jgi:WD40-like Beta Propeller Repeat
MLNPKNPARRWGLYLLPATREGSSPPAYRPMEIRLRCLGKRGAGRTHIYVKHLREDNPVRLTWDGTRKKHLAWSPDGRWIAYSRDVHQFGPNEVCIIPAFGGGVERKIARVTLRVPGPYMLWTPDSESLIVSDMIPQLQSSGLFLISVASG